MFNEIQLKGLCLIFIFYLILIMPSIIICFNKKYFIDRKKFNNILIGNIIYNIILSMCFYLFYAPKNLKDTNSADFTIASNAVTRFRVYVWLEGQDIDSLETDSDGAEVSISINSTLLAFSLAIASLYSFNCCIDFSNCCSFIFFKSSSATFLRSVLSFIKTQNNRNLFTLHHD